jgi:hypothetical protein
MHAVKAAIEKGRWYALICSREFAENISAARAFVEVVAILRSVFFAGFDCESTGGQSDGVLVGFVSLGAGATSENRRSSVGLDSGAPGQAAARAVR